MPKEDDLTRLCLLHHTKKLHRYGAGANTVSAANSARDNSNRPAQQPMPNTQLSATATPETKPAIADRSIGNTGGSVPPAFA